ncbi:hypothetical protein [Pseudomonas panipatensis]|uniref:Tetratricopeptide repeat-containing protein n=1 Tax=Pseudomonas panipatensis TaxID=428992 RepID=A0A1G8G8W5_9PSED|nr:hypothetical protein [Pseudomonas panipatensis]SDH90828.1 hypothetical protein SAMN05216272_10485 [Pseudomonas panipatensis]SMP44795.1 hypothetical protein SAMN06295951_101899 [Pseudomonas panipatensis]
MGLLHPYIRLAALGLPLWLAGCASQPAEEQHQLYRNDMLQAKLLIASADPANYALANSLLDRAKDHDQRGEASFYDALLKIRQHAPAEQVLPLLERAANADQPYAVALLYRAYSQPMLVQHADPQRAAQYRAAYAQLDVAKSGYPSFERAQEIVEMLLTQQPPAQ